MGSNTGTVGDGSRSAPAVDLRSDVLSPPTPEMFEAMARAPIGWPLRGEDPTVNELERLGAEILGLEAALFVPNATTANLLAVHTQGSRGGSVLMDQLAHINVVEWYPLALAGLLPRTIPSDRGHLDPGVVDAAFRDGAGGRAPRIDLLVLENTHTFAGGMPIEAAETSALADVAHRHGARVHIDGARLFDAEVALGIPARELVAGADTVAISLSKGLCAPYGGLLVGSRATVDAARDLANRIGFGRIHKAGHFAAAGIVALQSMIPRLADDHVRARRLGEAMAAMDGVQVDLETVRTNLVIARLDARFGDPAALCAHLEGKGLGLMVMPGPVLRAVVHRGVDDASIDAAIRILREELATS
jgi:threonine aldolase